MELISVIIPVYNVENYLEDCLKCVINQTYKNLEIILIDDGSKDDSGKICDEYAKKDNRIIVVHKENGGVSSARNEGLKIANGLYIGFVDPDDFISYDMYEILYLNSKRYNANVSVCKIKKVADRNIKERVTLIFQNTMVLNAFESMRYMLSFTEGYSCGPCNKLYKRQILRDFDTQFSNGEDLLFNFFVYFNDSNITVFYNRECYFYYCRNDSACQSPQFKQSYLKLIEIWKEILEQLLVSNTFKGVLPTAINSFKMVIWSTLFSLSYTRNKRNKKMFYKLKIKYKDILKKIIKYDKKNYLLNILYYLPYEILSICWRIYIKVKLVKF